MRFVELPTDGGYALHLNPSMVTAVRASSIDGLCDVFVYGAMFTVYLPAADVISRLLTGKSEVNFDHE